jgi:catechol 2,3-dioxygenase-like lactoylglutathione lyase family enzyme
MRILNFLKIGNTGVPTMPHRDLQKYREYQKQYRKKYYLQHKEEIIERTKQYHQDHRGQKLATNKKWRLAHKEHHAQKNKQIVTNLWNMILNHYGHKCNNCGETNELFLTLDHVSNDGYKNKLTTSTLYRRIIQDRFPDTFQILCWNCNCGKHRNGGILPIPEYRMDHTGWVTNDLEKFEKFWVEGLGFKRIWESNILPEKTQVLFNTNRTATAYRYQKDNMIIEIHIFYPLVKQEILEFDTFGINHIGLWVRDREKFIENLCEKIGPIEVKRFHDCGGWDNIFIRDLEGNWIELRTTL